MQLTIINKSEIETLQKLGKRFQNMYTKICGQRDYEGYQSIGMI